MQKSIFALCFLALSPAIAHAGGPVVVASDPVIAAPARLATFDWTGPYVGLGYGSTSADIKLSTGPAFDFESGTVASIHAGYLFQQGHMVYGGELSYGKISDTYVPGFGNDDRFENVLDLKGRVGYAADRLQVYGIVGYSKARYIGVPGGNWKAHGMSYGLGLEYAAANHVTIGVEYLARDLSGRPQTIPNRRDEFNLDTVSFRVSYKF